MDEYPKVLQLPLYLSHITQIKLLYMQLWVKLSNETSDGTLSEQIELSHHGHLLYAKNPTIFGLTGIWTV